MKKAMASNQDETKEKTVYVSRERKLEKLTRDGFGNKFLDNVDDFECPICVLVTRDTLQISACGHRFCSTCWQDWTRSAPSPTCCPIDGEEVDPNRVFEDRNADRKIRGLKVYCGNQELGCDATPELRDLEVHQSKCPYQTLACELGCGERVFVWAVDEHLQHDCPRRWVTCEACGEQLMAGDIQAHTETCPLKVVSCEFCHLEGLLNKDLVAHKARDCPSFPTYCSFGMLGCTGKIPRSDLPSHHQVSALQHLALVNSVVNLMIDNEGLTGGDAHDSLHRYELPAPLWGRVGRVETLAINRQMAALTDVNDRLTHEVDNLKEANIQLQNAIAISEQKNDHQIKQLESNHQTQQLQDRQIATLNDTSASYKTEIANNKQTHDQKIKKLTDTTGAIKNDLANHKQMYHQKIKNITDTNSSIKNDTAINKQKSDQQIKQLTDASEKITQAHDQQMAKLTNTNASLKNEIAKIKETCDKKIKVLNESNATLRKDIDGQNQKVQILEVANQRFVKLCEDMERKMKKLEKGMTCEKSGSDVSGGEVQVGACGGGPGLAQYAGGGSVGGGQVVGGQVVGVSRGKGGVGSVGRIVEIREGVRVTCPCYWRQEVTRDMGDVFSPPFYTQDGYKMCLKVSCGYWVNVQCYLMMGERDGELRWPWAGAEDMMVREVLSGRVLVGRDCGVADVGDRPQGEINDESLFYNDCIPHPGDGVRIQITVR